MVYVTQSRILYEKDGSYMTNTSVNPTVGAMGLPNPTQTTTSWRTGGADSDDLGDEFILAGSELQLAKVAKSDYHKNHRTSWDSGHTFDTERQIIYGDPRQGSFHIDGNPNSTVSAERRFWYEGPLVLNPATGPSPTGMYPNNMATYSSLNVDGPKAIAVTVPTNPAASLSVGAAEILREGIPQALGAAALKARALSAKVAGKEYLNVEFGWKPLVRDIQATARAVLNHSKILQQLERDSGRVVRRRFDWPVETSSVTSAGSMQLRTSGMPVYLTQAFNSVSGPATRILTSSRKKWFSGAYTYYLQGGSSTLSKMKAHQQKAELLLGLELTPEVLWELAPWSWLTDWVINVGDNFHNVSAFSSDGLVMRYGYIMVETKVVDQRALNGPLALKGGGSVSVPPLITGIVRKQRFRATPYGFGMNPGTFTGHQWSILAALGMAKSPGNLRVE